MVNGEDSFVLIDFQQRILLVGEKGQVRRLFDLEDGVTNVPRHFVNWQLTQPAASQDFDLLLFVFCGLTSDIVSLRVRLALFVTFTLLNDSPM